MVWINKIRNLKHRFKISLGIYKLNINDYPEQIYNSNFESVCVSSEEYDGFVTTHRGTVVNIEKHNLFKNRKNSDRLFFLLVDNHIAGYSHISFAEINEPASSYLQPLSPNEAYLFKDFVFEEFRGMSLHKFSIYKRLEYLKERAFDIAYVTIYEDNKYSVKSYSSLGFKKIKKWSCVKVGKLKITKEK